MGGGSGAGPAFEDEPVRTHRLVFVQSFAVVATYALGQRDLRPLNRTPVASLLAHFARLAFVPALDAKDGEVGQQTQTSPDRAQVAAIEVADEQRRDEKNRQ